MNLIDNAIFGFITIFIVSLVAIIGFLVVGGYVYPIMKDISANVTSPIDVGEKLDFGLKIFYLAMGILVAIPFVLIAVKYFYEKEPYTY